MKTKTKTVDKSGDLNKKKRRKGHALKKAKRKGNIELTKASVKSSFGHRHDETKSITKSENKSSSFTSQRTDVSKALRNVENGASKPIKKAKKENRKQKQSNKTPVKEQTVNTNRAEKPINVNIDNGSKGYNHKKIQKLKSLLDKKLKQSNTNENLPTIKEKTVNNYKINVKRLEQMLSAKGKIPTGNTEHKEKVNESQSLRDRMMAKLKASRFRYLNETLYNNESSESKKLFKDDPDAFIAYHEGYKQQVEQWPLNPLDIIINAIKKLPKDHVIADFGCGEARLAISVPQKVHSFDLVAVNDNVKACDMAHTPLLMDSVNVVIFCLSLMGNNLNDYIIEANRILKKDGILKIAEVESRFEDVEEFIKILKSYGFVNTWKDLSHNLFYFMDFKKESKIEVKRNKLPSITLKSCLYKKR